MSVLTLVSAFVFAAAAPDPSGAAVCMAADSASPALSGTIAALSGHAPREVRITTEAQLCTAAAAAVDAVHAEPLPDRGIYVFRVNGNRYAVVDVLRRTVGDYAFARGVIMFFDSDWKLLNAVML